MTIRLWPRSLIGQLVLAVAITLFIAQAFNLVMLVRGQRQEQLAHGGGMAVARIIDAVGEARLENRAPLHIPGQHRTGRHSQRITISIEPRPVPRTAVEWPEMADYIGGLLDEAGTSVDSVQAWRMKVEPGATNPRRLGRLFVRAKYQDRFINVRARVPIGGERIQGFLLWQTIFLYLILLGPILIIAWRASRPLRDLTRAARVGPIADPAAPIEERGPSDVRDLISAFNAYRGRIGTMLSDKDRMLGAVGHDLRTPLASLRVRVEAVENATLRDKMIATIDEMAAMLADILAVARSGAGKESAEQYDPATLMAQLGEEYRTMDKPVCGPDAMPTLSPLTGRPLLIRRALRNLVDNALVYGGGAILLVEKRAHELWLIVRDEGPGIDPALVADLVEPFARGETSRNRTTGGAGLGLAIANTLAAGEGGRLVIADRVDARGLDAAIVLPLA